MFLSWSAKRGLIDRTLDGVAVVAEQLEILQMVRPSLQLRDDVVHREALRDPDESSLDAHEAVAVSLGTQGKAAQQPLRLLLAGLPTPSLNETYDRT